MNIRIRNAVTGCLLGCLAFLAVSLPRQAPGASASPGDPDRSFGSGGIARADFGGVSAAHAVIGSNGKLLAVGTANQGGTSDFQFALARFTTDGVPDATFGNAGTVLTRIGNGEAVANTAANVGGGKFIVSGRAFNGLDNDFALARYNADGSLDTSFGQNGIVITQTGPGNDRIFLSVPLDNDQLLQVGLSSIDGRDSLMMAQYNPNGSLDGQFGRDGIAVDPAAAGPPIGIDIQDNGGILIETVVGQTDYITRYSPTGTRDLEFGQNGSVSRQLGEGLQVVNRVRPLAGGRLLVAGERDGRFAVARYYGNGFPDTTFATGGIALLQGGPGLAWGFIGSEDNSLIYAAGDIDSTFVIARLDNALTPAPPSDLLPYTAVYPDSSNAARTAPVQQVLGDLLGRMRQDYGLVPSLPIRVYVSNSEQTGRAILRSNFGSAPSDIDDFFDEETVTLALTQLGDQQLFLYLPNVSSLEGDLAFYAASYTLRTIGGGFEQADAYPRWFLRGFEQHVQSRVTGGKQSSLGRARQDVLANSAPALSTIATVAGASSYAGSNSDRLTSIDARGQATVDYIAERFGESAIKQLLQENAFGSVTRFNSISQRITSLSVDQLNSAVSDWLRQRPAS